MRLGGVSRPLYWRVLRLPCRLAPRERACRGAQPDCGKIQVGVGFGAAQAVMQMCGMKHQAQFPAPLGERPQQRHRIGAAGKADGKAQTGLEQHGINWQC